MPKAHFNPAVDAYIDNAKPFALPILLHLRKLIHRACPGVQEGIKWSRPFFELNGTILCGLAAYTHHCSLIFWSQEINAVLREAGALKEDGLGSLGRITSLKDLPPDAQLLDWLRQAASFIESGNHTSPIAARKVTKRNKPAPVIPDDLTAALSESHPAAATFEALSPSCRREYVDWIVAAKRSETRAKRIATTVQQLAQGKQLHWRYAARGGSQPGREFAQQARAE